MKKMQKINNEMYKSNLGKIWSVFVYRPAKAVPLNMVICIAHMHIYQNPFVIIAKRFNTDLISYTAWSSILLFDMVILI